MKHAVIFFANGTEECEALIVVDILRRAGVDLQIAAVGGSLELVSSHKVVIRADVLAENVDFSAVDALILPGGMPGTTNMEADSTVRGAVQAFMTSGKLTAAICAAPSILAHMGLLKGRRATSYSSFQTQLTGAEVLNQEVVEDGNLITSWGLGGAIPFALTLAERLSSAEEAQRIRQGIAYVH